MPTAIKMKTLAPEFEGAKYYGFTLKAHFGYGLTCRGQYCASSGWTCENYLAVYVKCERGWELRWYPIEKVEWEGHSFLHREEEEEEYYV